MILRKWNYEDNTYHEIERPDSWTVKVYTTDMSEIVNCSSCGKPFKFGECYTSLEIHDQIGMGYAVCPKCYYLERKRRVDYERGK